MPPIKKEQVTIAAHDIQLPPAYTGIRCRLFYPTTPTSHSFFKRHSRFPHDGTPHHFPKISTRGIVRFVNLPSILGCFVQLAPSISAIDSNLLRNGGSKDGESRPMRVVLFSHGAFALASVYNNLCMEIAKGGFLVVAIEHGEGSALGTVIQREEGRREVKYFERKGRSLQGDLGWRRRQMEQRIREMVGVVEYLREVNCGNEVLVTTRGKKGVDLRERLWLDRVHVCGHSFGGASCLGFAIDRPEWCDKIILMDPWLKSVGKERLKKGVGVNTHLLLITDEISRTQASERIAQRVHGENLIAEKIILNDAGHHIQTDVAQMLPRFIGRRIKFVKSDAKNKPSALNTTNNIICREFLSDDWTNFKTSDLTHSAKFAGHLRMTTL